MEIPSNAGQLNWSFLALSSSHKWLSRNPGWHRSVSLPLRLQWIKWISPNISSCRTQLLEGHLRRPPPLCKATKAGTSRPHNWDFLVFIHVDETLLSNLHDIGQRIVRRPVLMGGPRSSAPNGTGNCMGMSTSGNCLQAPTRSPFSCIRPRILCTSTI